MLPAANRLTDSSGFTTATRGGRRCGGRGIVVHVSMSDVAHAAEVQPVAAARVGLIVSRAVGGAVVRNRVKRRLRHLLRDRLAVLPDGSVIAVRALPSSALMSAAELGADLDRCFSRAGLTVSSSVTPSLETVTE